MADTKVTGLTEVSVPALDDYSYLVDVSDTTDAASGSSRKVVLNRLLGALQYIACGRLTLSTGTPVTIADTGSTDLFWTPYNGNLISLYDGTRWKLYTFTERTLATVSAATTQAISCTTVNTSAGVTTASTTNIKAGMPVTGTGIQTDTLVTSITDATHFVISQVATTSATNTLTFYTPNYDVFLYDNSGTLTLSATAWTSDTARATALTTQDGVYVKSGDTAKRYLGSYRLIGATTGVPDKVATRYVWNCYNRLPRPVAVGDGTSSWTYSTAAWRIANNATANQIQVFCGLRESSIHLTAAGFSSSTGSSGRYSGIGYDSTTANSATIGAGIASGTTGPSTAAMTHQTEIGYHSYAWLEYAVASGTITWTGNNTLVQTGITGFYWA